jgi:hypothetical protein
MPDLEQRLAAVETRLENAFALDARLKAVESGIGKRSGSTLRDWLQTLGPYAAGLIVLLVGYWIKDSVALALQREQLDLAYVTQMRDLIRDFDSASTQSAADANAIGLAMYGRHAIIPLVERLEGGDVAPLAAERGLRLVGNLDPALACPPFTAIVTDQARRFKWQTHKTMIRVIGQSSCVDSRTILREYHSGLQALGNDPAAIARYARRYSEVASFDPESIAALTAQIEQSLEILDSMAPK